MSTTEERWVSPVKERPKNGQRVWIMDSSGYTQPAIYHSNLWHLGEDGTGMYIYYEPTMWKTRP